MPKIGRTEKLLRDMDDKLETIIADIKTLKLERVIPDGDVVLDLDDVCRLSHLSHRQIQRIDKHLGALHIGRRKLYIKSNVINYFKSKIQ